MTGQLTVLDTPSLWYRAFHGIPDSVVSPRGEPVNALRGTLDMLARLITDPVLASTNGKYFEGLKEIPSSVDSYDAGRAEELWQSSAVLTGMVTASV